MVEKTITPGRVLAAAREAMSLSQEEIAKQLHLSVQTIKDIEHDTYEKMGVRTYVRGYLCAYARLVGVLEKHVLDALDESGLMPVEAHSVLPIIEGAPVRNVTRQESPLRFSYWKISVGVLVLFIIILFVSCHEQKRLPEKPIITKTEISTEPAPLALSQPVVSPANTPLATTNNNGFVKKKEITNMKEKPPRTTYTLKPAE